MELKTKYQYTYFIYPYIIEQKNYAQYMYKLLRNKQIKLKIFERKKDIELDSYFLPEIKDKMFWTLDLKREGLKDFGSMDIKMKANVLSKKACCFFEYYLDEDIPAKIGETDGIFFDITKIEIICFNTGVCFLLFKTTLNSETTFNDVLNFNYKFRDIASSVTKRKDYDNIKIQTNKFQNMQEFTEFIKQIAGLNIMAKQINLDTSRLITYAYTCLDQNSWNENNDISLLEKEFEKYRNILPAGEQIDDITKKQEDVYKEKYLYYSFFVNSTVLLTSASNIKNYTSVLFEYENVQLYHFIYHLYQKVTLKKLNYEFNKTKQFSKVKEKFIKFAKKDWIYEVTNSIKGMMLEKYFKKAQNLDETFSKLKNEYDLLYKEERIKQIKKRNKYVVLLIIILIIVIILKLSKII